MRDVEVHLERGRRSISSLHPYSYTADGANIGLRLVPGEGLDWATWGEVLRLFVGYGDRNEYRETKFVVSRPADRVVVARGHLVAVEE